MSPRRRARDDTRVSCDVHMALPRAYSSQRDQDSYSVLTYDCQGGSYKHYSMHLILHVLERREEMSRVT